LGLGAEGRLAPLFGLVLIGETLALLLRGINLGQHHITAYNLATLVQRLCYLSGVLAFTIGRGLALPNVLAAWLGAVAVSVLMTGAWIWRRSAAVDISWRLIRDGWGRSLGKGLRALLTISLTLLLIRADVYMLGPMLGKATVGQVSVASSLAEYLWYVPTILGSVLFAAVAADRGPDTVAKICRGSRTMVLGLVPAAVLLAIAGRPLVTFIYGSSYATAGTLFVLLLPGMLAIALHLIIDSFFTGSGYPPVSYLSAAGALVCKVSLNLVAVPRFGVVGAVTVTSLVYLALLSVKVAAFTRQAGVGLPSLFSPTWSDVTHGVGLVRSWTRRAAGRVPAPGA
jgi:O-antigen/teichoic acid export membrane protein